MYKCREHGEVRQDLQNHLKGKGCPLCGRGFINKAIPVKTYLYVIHFYNLNLWKLGVTIHTLSRRYNNESEPYNTSMLVAFPIGEDAYIVEKELSVRLKEYKYYGKKVLKSGNTELYTCDITEHTTQYLGDKGNPLHEA